MAPLSPLHRHGCARLNVMRLNAARLNVYEPWVSSSVDGVANPGGSVPGAGLRIEGASIEHALNDQTDTASFRARGFTPIAGQTIRVQSGDNDLEHRLFAGRIIERTTLYEGDRQHLVAYDLRCVDPTWLLGRRLVLKTYTNQSATAIVLDLVASFTRNVTTVHVQAGLALIDAITFANEYVPQCLTALCQRIGAYWYLDYAGDLHVFTSEAPDAVPITDAQPRTSRGHTLTEDLSQVATKVIGRGGGGQVAIDTPANETALPLDTSLWYADAGGLVEVGAQLLTYTGVRGRAADTGDVTAGALVGTGNAPGAGPTVWLASVAGSPVGVGTYLHAVSFVTASGETVPGPTTSRVVPGSAAIPMATATAARSTGTGTSGMTAGGTYRFVVGVKFYGGGMIWTPASVGYVVDGKWWEVYLGTATIAGGVFTSYGYYYPDLGQTWQNAPIEFTELYRTTNGGSTYYRVKQSAGAVVVAGWWLDSSNVSDAALVSLPQLPAAVGTLNAMLLTDIPIGASGSGVTQRKLYRTAANSSTPLKLRTTLADNTTTTSLDSVADAALGASAPATDTSGISDNRSVPAGSTSLPVSSTAPFDADGGAAGGWVRVGSVPVKYTGIGAGALTGIPATGVGALTAPVRYGTQVVVQPRLIGVVGLALAATQGETVTIRLEQSDAAAVAAMAERLKLPGGSAVTEEGVIEVVVSDSKWTPTELAAQVQATLAERKDPRLVLTFESRDPSLQVGRLITVTLTQPPISGTFRIQKIAFSEIGISGARATVAPLRTVEASNKLYSFSDLLRQLRGREGGVG